MRVSNYQVSGQAFKKSVVYKDNFTMGIRAKRPQDQPVPEEEFGLVTYKLDGDGEFWLNFENDTRLLVEHQHLERNPQKIKPPPEPPKPTPEEIAAEEARLKAEAARAKGNKSQ